MILQRHILYCGPFYFKQNENRLQSSQKSRPEGRVDGVGGQSNVTELLLGCVMCAGMQRFYK